MNAIRKFYFLVALTALQVCGRTGDFICQVISTGSQHTLIKCANSDVMARALVLPSGLNTEAARISNDIQDPEYQIGLIDNAMFGVLSSSASSNIYIAGKTDPSDNVSIVLNTSTYTARTNGQWGYPGLALKNFIGTTVTVQINSGSTNLVTRCIYVPKPHLASKLAPTSLTISTTGNTLYWTVDTANTSGYVVLNYRVADANDHDLASDAISLPDNGSYCIDGLLTNSNGRKIDLDLISGNTVSTTVGGKKLLLFISTWDHHSYYFNY